MAALHIPGTASPTNPIALTSQRQAVQSVTGHSPSLSRTARRGLGTTSQPPLHARKRRVTVRAATGLKEELKEFANAERRWQSQISDGKVKSLSSKEAGYAYQLADYVLLDVRPSFERNKSWVKDSVWVPAFDTDKNWSPGAAASRLSMFFFGGWWNGSVLTKRNERFMADVVAKVPRGANIIVACQRGLRSLAACEHLYKAGYRNLYWLNGGFNAAAEEDFKREGPEPLNFAGLGGFSEFIGWTDQQKGRAQREGLSYRMVFFGRLVAVLLGGDLAFLALQQFFAYLRGEAQ